MVCEPVGGMMGCGGGDEGGGPWGWRLIGVVCEPVGGVR